MTTSDPTIMKLRFELRASRAEKMRLLALLKDLERHLKVTAEPDARALIQEQIDQFSAELDTTIEQLQANTMAMEPLLEAEAGKDGRLSRETLTLLRTSLHLDDDYIEVLFAEGYKDLRETNPDLNLLPLRLLANRNEVLMALALVEGCHVLPGEERAQLLKRIPISSLSQGATAAVTAAVETYFQIHGHRVGKITAWIADIAASSTMVADVPVAFNAVEAPCVHDYAVSLLNGIEPAVPYLDFSKAYFERINKEMSCRDPHLMSCVAKTDPIAGQNTRPMTAHWLCREGMPTTDQLKAFNEVIARTSPSLDIRTVMDVYLGQAPFGCAVSDTSPISPGNDKLLMMIEKVCEHANLFMTTLPEDTAKDDATGASLHWYLRKYFVMFGGLGFEVLRTVMRTLARQGVDGADLYAEMKDPELGKVLNEISSTNSDPATGYGVLRPDLVNYLPAIETSGLVPTFIKLVACMSLFKYVSHAVLPPTETESSTRHVLIVHYGDHPAIVVPIARGYLEQPLSEGVKYTGHGPLRDTILRHLKWTGIANAEVETIIDSLFATLRPKDFPERKPLSANPFLLVSPCPSFAVVLKPSDSCPHDRQPFFNIRCRPSIHRFTPDEKKVSLIEEWATEAETILYAFPHSDFDATADVEFRQSLPEAIIPQRFSVSIAPYLKNINHLGFPQGLLDSFDVLVGGDISRSAFPDAPIIVMKVRHEIFLFTNVPDDPSEKKRATDNGKSTFTLAVAGTGNLALEVSPVSGSDSAPSLRVLVAEHHKCDGTFFIDESLDISNPNHPLSDRSLKMIATSGKGPSPGIAGGNGKPLVYRHPIASTRKYPLSDDPDTVNRSLHVYHGVLTDATKMTAAEFAYFSSMKFRIQSRLNYLAWMYVSGFAKTIYKVTSQRVATRFEGHDGLAGALLGDGTTTNADLSQYKGYMAAANGEKCQKQYAMALESDIVASESGRTIVHVKDWFEQCPESVLGGIADGLMAGQPFRTAMVWERIVCGAHPDDYYRIAGANGFAKVRGGMRTLPKLFMDAAKEGKLVRDDGWRAAVKTVTLPNGAHTEYVVALNDLTAGKKDDYSEAKVVERLGIMRKKYDKT